MNEKNIVKESLKVICIKSTSRKLIKGGIYSASCLNTQKCWHSNDYFKTIYIDNIGSYNSSYFTNIDGTSFDNTADFTTKYQKNLDCGAINYTGQLVRCSYGSGKILKEGEIYFVEEQKNRTIRIKGSRFFYSSYNFNEIPVAKQRLIKLKELKGEKTKTGDQTRKFLLFTENEKKLILFELLYKVLINLRSVELKEKPNIPKLMLSLGGKYNIIEKEVIEFLSQEIDNLIKTF